MVRATAVCSCLLPPAICPALPLATTWLSRLLAVASFPPHHHHHDQTQSQSQSQSQCRVQAEVQFEVRPQNCSQIQKQKPNTHTHFRTHTEYTAGNDSYQLCLSLWPTTTHKAKPPTKRATYKHKQNFSKQHQGDTLLLLTLAWYMYYTQNMIYTFIIYYINCKYNSHVVELSNCFQHISISLCI